MNATLSAAAQMMHGELHGGDQTFAGVSTDTRSLQAGELFFALTGPNFDGAAFVAQAAAAGAAGAVVSAPVAADIAQIVVSDTRLALGELGRAWRQQHAATVVGITGSNGKTTLKEMIAACLAQQAETMATAGNFNNDIGVPLMLMRINAEHRFAVIEMGANHGGEIAYLTSLAEPNLVVLSNAGSAHLEGFGSLRGVAEGKGEILQGQPRPDCAVLNADDDYFDFWSALVDDIDRVSFGLGDAADVRATDIRAGEHATVFRLHLPEREVEVELPLPGIHNVRNACAAAAVASQLGTSAAAIATALASMQPVGGRLQPLAGLHGATIYDDSYNANPVSVLAAGQFLATLDGPGWMVLGDMGELGSEAERLHAQLGADLKAAGVARLYAVGALSAATAQGFGDNAAWFASMDELIAAVSRDVEPDVNLLIKGSRSARMERAVAALQAPSDLVREA